MEELSSLASLPVGARGVVASVSLPSTMEKRLASFGLIEGTEVECVMRAPCGEPAAYRVRGALLALRKSDCRQIRLRSAIHSKPNNDMTIVLAGNPNVGKSTVFNALTGMRQHTGNWCGKTVESAKGVFGFGGRTITLLDTPGTYSLLSDMAEEIAARDTLCTIPHDCVICVCDATRLERGLILVLQILEMSRKVVLCVNCMDAARQQGIDVDLQRLSALLGIPVVGVSARNRMTLRPLVEAALSQAAMLHAEGVEIRYPEIAERAIACAIAPIAAACAVQQGCDPRWLAVHMLMPSAKLPVTWDSKETAQTVQDGIRRGRHLLHEANMTTLQYEKLVAATVILRASAIARKVVKDSPKAMRLERRIDRLVTHRRWGWLIMGAMLFFVFWLTILGANVPSAMLYDLMERGCSALDVLAQRCNLPDWCSGALIDGALRGTCRVVSVMLPPMAIFFPLFTILEDSGLLPRIAFNADAAFARCHACGKQSLTMAMGFGCNAVGVTESRIIGSRRERLIAILTNSFVPCNGRFPHRLGIHSVRKDEGNGQAAGQTVYQKSYRLP